MWESPSPDRSRHNDGPGSTRGSRAYRPSCAVLEDRCLLSVTLSDSEPPGHLVGLPVAWTATTSDHGASPVYQFSVGPVGQPAQVVRAFSPSNSFIWNPLQEGSFEIEVTVKDGYSASTSESTTAVYTSTSRITGHGATVNRTTNPLVALYTAPPTSGSGMYVQFKLLGSQQPWSSTAVQPIVPGKSTNFLVAGLMPNKTYVMRHVLLDGRTSPARTFRTGSLPAYLAFPNFTVQQPPSRRADLTQNTVLHLGVNPPDGAVDTLATDRQGHIVWYYDPVANAFPSYGTSLVTGGTLLLLGLNQDGVGGASTLREVDLAGDTVRETNIDAVNAELAALGQHPITNFNHEAQRLPNGDTAVLASSKRTVNLNGTPTQYTGDMVLVLDPNFNVAWVWDPFQWLDINRLPTQGEGPADWLHANAISWSPADGNLLVSLRSQDWVVKIDYANGTGDGHVIWRLGQGGDFTINSADPLPWFSHQHDAHYVDNTTLVVFDNGNTRKSLDPTANSRGQALVLNEQTMQATLVSNVNLGTFSPAVGSAQRLPNGNLVFDSGFTEQTVEVRPNGVRTYALKMNLSGAQYRSFIFNGLYGNTVSPRPAWRQSRVTG